jgi:hypothetical protein
LPGIIRVAVVDFNGGYDVGFDSAHQVDFDPRVAFIVLWFTFVVVVGFCGIG